METSAKVTGSCLCGAVRFEADGPPRRVTHCHCTMCRRATGAVAGTFAAWDVRDARFVGKLARYDSSAIGWRGFCRRCGSSLCFGYKPRPERVYVAVGILDAPERFPAGFHDHRESRISWLDLDGHLPDAPRSRGPSTRRGLEDREGSFRVGSANHPEPRGSSMKVLFEKRGSIAYVTINRPERLNACDFETYERLADVWREFRDDPSLRVGILTGSGERAFCAGSDIKANFVERSGEEPRSTPFPVLFDLYKPVIAAINGHANGGGLEQMLACDIRVAARHAQFGLGEVRLGLLPGGGGTQRLPRLIPLGRALEMLFTGNRIDAEEALRLGLVDYVVPHDQLMSKCEAIAAEICKSAPLAVQRIKQAALRGLDLALAEGLKLEHELYESLQRTEDAREGALAFAEKRSPRWQGK